MYKVKQNLQVGIVTPEVRSEIKKPSFIVDIGLQRE